MNPTDFTAVIGWGLPLVLIVTLGQYLVKMIGRLR